MSFSDRLLLWLHIGFAIFTIGPVTLAVMSTPRYIRQRNVDVLRYLSRITFVFTLASLGVILAGLFLGQLLHEAGKPWLIIAATLFVVSLVLLLLVVRDQRQAISAIGAAADQAAHDAAAGAAATAAAQAAAREGAGDPASAAGESADNAAAGGTAAAAATPQPQIASVERGRIAMLGGIVVLIWLIILVLMIWH